MRVKICGITTLHDAELSIKMGAYALGFNFYKKSSRYIAPEYAAKIIQNLPQNSLTIGIFVNSSSEEIAKIQRITQIQIAQLHGDESLELCSKITLPVIKAIRPQIDDDRTLIKSFAQNYQLLIDAPNTKEFGGTGQLADWSIAKELSKEFPIILAGGLNAENIKNAIISVQPQMVDVCSGVEESPGIKSKEKLQAFFDAIKEIL